MKPLPQLLLTGLRKSRCSLRVALTLFNLCLMATAWMPGSARAAINVGSVTVPSIGHSFRTNPFPFVSDLLIDQLQAGGGATNSPVSLDLDTATQITFTVQSPPGMNFLVTVPAGATPLFVVDLGWRQTNSDSGTSLGVTVSFQNLQGTAPTFANSCAVGANNRFFTFNSTMRF